MRVLIAVALVAIMLVSCSKNDVKPWWEVSPTEKVTLDKVTKENNPYSTQIINGDTVKVATYFTKNLVNGKTVVAFYLSRAIDVDVRLRYWYHTNNPSDPPSIAFDITVPKGQTLSSNLFPDYSLGVPIGGGFSVMTNTGKWVFK